MTHIIAADGGVTVSTYSSTLHQQLSSTDPVGRSQSWAYDSNGNMTSSTDGGGFVTTIACEVLRGPSRSFVAGFVRNQMHLLTNSNLLRLDSDESSYISYNLQNHLSRSIAKPQKPILRT